MADIPDLDWVRYGIPSSLKVKKSKQYGRGVYASTPLGRGEEVLKAEPYVYVLNNDVVENYCHCCLTKLDRSVQSRGRCKQCEFLWYCSEDCQAQDWKYRHKRECRSITEFKKRCIDPDIPKPQRLAIRALRQRKKEKKQGAEWKIDLLYSYAVEDMSTDQREELTKAVGEVHQLCCMSSSKSKTVSEDQWPCRMTKKKSDLIFDLLCKVCCNTFSILTADLSVIGAGLYIAPSLFNHSCVPNCNVVFEGPVLKIRTIENIKAGEQLFISYLVDLVTSPQRRQSTLKTTYKFECKCDRCKDQMKKPDSSIDSPYQQIYAAHVDVEKEVREAFEEGVKSLENIEALKEERDMSGIVKEAEKSLKRLSAVLHPRHIVTVLTWQHLKFASMALEDYPRVLKASEELKEPYRHHLPRYHPQVGIHLLRLAQLQCQLHHRPSIKDLQQAVDVLKVAYGEEHPMTREAEELLHSTEQLCLAQP